MYVLLIQAFSDGCVGDWGGGDYQDLMSGLDCALAQNDWIDANQLGISILLPFSTWPAGCVYHRKTPE